MQKRQEDRTKYCRINKQEVLIDVNDSYTDSQQNWTQQQSQSDGQQDWQFQEGYQNESNDRQFKSERQESDRDQQESVRNYQNSTGQKQQKHGNKNYHNRNQDQKRNKDYNRDHDYNRNHDQDSNHDYNRNKDYNQSMNNQYPQDLPVQDQRKRQTNNQQNPYQRKIFTENEECKKSNFTQKDEPNIYSEIENTIRKSFAAQLAQLQENQQGILSTNNITNDVQTDEQSQKTLYQNSPQKNFMTEKFFWETPLDKNEPTQKSDLSNRLNKLPKIAQCQMGSYGTGVVEKMDLLWEILAQAKGLADIKITFTSMDPKFIQWSKLNLERNKKIQFEFLDEEPINKPSVVIDNQQQDDHASNNVINYQFQQQLNGLTPIQKMIFVYQKNYLNIQEKAQQQNITLNHAAAQSALILSSNDDTCLRNFFKTEIEVLDQIFILIHKCESQDELDKKFYILSQNKQKLKELFSKYNWDQDIYYSKMIDVKFFKTFKDQLIYDKSVELKQEFMLIFYLNINKGDDQNSIQNEFNNFMDDPKNIRTEQSQFKVEFDQSVQDFEQLRKEVMCLQKFQFKMQTFKVEDPIFNINRKKWVVYIIITHWLTGQKQQKQQTNEKIEKQLSDILSGVITYRINQENQINIWNNFLRSKYEQQGKDNQIVISTSEMYQNDGQPTVDLEIKSLKGLADVARSVCENLDSDLLQKFCQTNIKLRIEDLEINQAIKFERIQKVFQQDFQNIYLKFQNNIKFQFIEIQANDKALFYVYHDKLYQDQQIKDQINEILIFNLKKQKETLDLQKFLDFLQEKSIDQFEEKYAVFVKGIDKDSYLFISTNKNFVKLNDLFSNFRTNQIKHYKEFKVDLNHPVIFKYIMQKFELSKFQLPVQHQLAKNIINIQGEQQFMKKLVKQILKEIELFQKSMFQSKVKLHFKEYLFLQKQKVTEIDSLSDEFNCMFKFTDQVQGQQTYPDKFKWSWQDKVDFVDYPQEISSQIDQAYKLYQSNKTLKEFQYISKPNDEPSTHLIDLSKMTIFQKNTNQTHVLQYKRKNYLINNEKLQQEIQQYIGEQNVKGIQQFGVLINQYKIVFSDDKIQQLNILTNFSRLVNYEPISENALPQMYLIVKGQKQDTINLAVECIYNILILHQTKETITVPEVDDKQLQQMKDFIIENTITCQGKFVPGGQLKIFGFMEEFLQIQSMLKMLSLNFQYPPSWIQQQENFLKVQILVNDPDYIQVSQYFKETLPTRTIYQINRIQNKKLYQNYEKEKKDMIQRNNKRNTHLTNEEQERLVWHGVSNEHPQKIYNSNNNAFDVTYANEGMWGRGAYFAVNASYSVDYSYALQATEDLIHQGKMVFLCCKIALGKSYPCQAQPLLRPPAIQNKPGENFDSVTGNTNGSQVFILYSMDVRRAYPAYEVIYL